MGYEPEAAENAHGAQREVLRVAHGKGARQFQHHARARRRAASARNAGEYRAGMPRCVKHPLIRHTIVASGSASGLAKTAGVPRVEGIVFT